MNGKCGIFRAIAWLLCFVLLGTILPVVSLAAPGTPVLINATASGEGIKVTWNTVAGATDYRVFRKGDGKGWTPLGNTASTSYQDNSAKAGVTYTYTVRAIDGSGMSDYDKVGVSAAWTKSTAGYIATPKLVSATAEGTGIRIKWNKVTGADGYRIFRKTGTAGWSALTNVGDVDEYLDTSCVSKKKYTYTVRCLISGEIKSDYNTTGVSATWDSGIAPGDLAAPVLVSAVAQGSGIHVTWNSVTGAAAYRIYRKEGSGGWQYLVDVSTTDYQDNSASSGKKYTYTVRCLNGSGKIVSDYDHTGVTGIWNQGSGGSLDTPVLIKAENKIPGVIFTWNAVTGASGYRVYRKTGNSGWKTVGDTTGTSYTDTDVISGTKYTYTVRAKNASDNIDSGYDGIGVGVTYYEAPQLIKAEEVTSGIKLSWKAVNKAPRYLIYRDSGSGFQQIGSTTSTNYIDTTCPAGVDCTYTVKVISSDGKQHLSDYDHTGITAIYAGKAEISEIYSDVGGVRLKWKAMAGATQYRVYRKSEEGTWVLLTVIAATEYLDTAAVNGNKHTYTIRAVDSGNSFVGTYDTVGKTVTYYATPKLIDCIRLSDGLETSWEAVEHVTYYKVYRKIASGSWECIALVTGTKYLDTKMPSGTMCTYTVRCADSGATNLSSYDHAGKGATSFMEKPVLVSAKNEDGQVVFKWNEVDKATYYQVYRKTGEQESYTPVAVVAVTEYVDVNVDSGKTYTYTVATSDGTDDLSEYNTTGITTTYYVAPVLKSIENVVSGVELKWNNVENIAQYQIYRKTGSEDWKTIGSTNGTSFIDTSVVNNGNYSYTVACIKNGAIVSAYDPVGMTSEFFAPPLIKSATVNGNKIIVTWGAVEGIDTYRLYRKEDGGNYAILADVSGSVTTYDDTAITSGKKYTYAVRCMKGGIVVSAYKDSASATYLAAPTGLTVTSPDKGQAKVTWTAVTGASSYIVYYKTAAQSTWNKTIATGSEYTVKGLTSNGYYTFCVSAKASDGTASPLSAKVDCQIK